MFKRPICIATIGFIIGILMGLYLQKSIAFLLIMWIIFLVISVLLYLFSKKYIKAIILFTCAVLISNISINVLEEKYNTKYNNFSNNSTRIKAVIVSEPTEKEYKYSYNIKVIEPKEYKNTYLLLNIKKQGNSNLLQYGNLVELTGEWKEPEVARNYMGFNYKEYLKTKKIYGIIHTTNNQVSVIKPNNVTIFENIVYSFSSKIKKQINKILPDELAALCIGILLGDKSNISEENINNFKDSNLSHMLAVSGAHVSYVIIGIGYILGILGKKATKIITILFLLFFMALTNYTPSVIRACIMCILQIIATLSYRKSDIYNNLSISTMIILIANPYSLFDMGFQLSYMGTIGIVVFEPKLKTFFESKLKNKREENILKLKIKQKGSLVEKTTTEILNLFIISISANIMLIPIVLYHFNKLSLTFYISNILASPILGITIILGFITVLISIFFAPISFILTIVLKICLQLLVLIANLTSKIPFSKILLPTPKIIYILIYYTFLLLICYRKQLIQKGIFKKIIIILLCICILFTFFFKIQNKNLRIYFIDVGQGDSTLICTPTGENILIDGGGNKSNEKYDVGEKVLLPYLLDRGINRIDYLMISHFDSDHVVGLFEVIKNIKIDCILISKQGESSENYTYFKSLIKEKQIKVEIVKLGDKIQINKECSLEILFPEDNLITNNIINNNSIVAKFRYNQFSILFTGDIEEIAENKLLELYKNTNILKSTILKVAHHGSKSSTIENFLERVKPKIALIGAGKDNLYGHPNSNVLQRLEDLRC